MLWMSFGLTLLKHTHLISKLSPAFVTAYIQFLWSFTYLVLSTSLRSKWISPMRTFQRRAQNCQAWSLLPTWKAASLADEVTSDRSEVTVFRSHFSLVSHIQESNWLRFLKLRCSLIFPWHTQEVWVFGGSWSISIAFSDLCESTVRRVSIVKWPLSHSNTSFLCHLHTWANLTIQGKHVVSSFQYTVRSSALLQIFKPLSVPKH